MEIKEVKRQREKRIVESFSWPITFIFVLIGNFVAGYLLNSDYCLITLKVLAGIGVLTVYVSVGVAVRFAVSKNYRNFRLRKTRIEEDLSWD